MTPPPSSAGSSDSKENKELIMAKRIKDAEIIDNKSTLNPLQAPFAYIDGSISIDEVFKNSLKLLFSHKTFKNMEDSGFRETIDVERMNKIDDNINKLKQLEEHGTRRRSLETAITSVRFENKENETINLIDNLTPSEPITLPNRNSTWKHSNKERFIEKNIVSANSNNETVFSEIQKLQKIVNLDLNDPQLILDEKNDAKTSNAVNSLLLGSSDIIGLTSSLFHDENGLRKGPLLLNLLSVYLTDITTDVYLTRSKLKNSNNPNVKNLLNNPSSIDNDKLSNIITDFNNEDLLKLSTFAKNRIYRFHLEYGIGNHVLRWDIEKDVKSLLYLHKKLLKRSTKERSEVIRRKDMELPKFPILPSHFAKLKGLINGDKEIHYYSGNPENPEIPIPIQREATNNTIESSHSIARTLTRFPTNFRIPNYKRKTENNNNNNNNNTKALKEKYLLAIRERNKLNSKYKEDMQTYFDNLIKNFANTEQSTRILQFFELSSFSFLLSNEIYRKRKEGFLFIVSSTNKQGWKVGHFNFHDINEMIRRHSSKWCILGDSFLLYSSNNSSTTPEEVFLFDSKTVLTIKGLDDLEKLKMNNERNLYEFQFNENKGREDDDDDDDDNVNDVNDVNDGIDLHEHEDNYFENSNKILKDAKFYPTIKISNSERSIKLIARNPKITMQWALAFRNVINETEWAKPHRFNSFAPVRSNCFAQWFVDARDYWYAASSAIEMAKDVIYIHDWWLSPELYLRRPANGNQNYRIDRLLQKKAEQGVKIFIIVYRNVGTTVVTDSMYTKHSFLDLHENIYVLRSPNQIMQNVFFWAHHEKLLIIDNSIGFVGGIDLCFGRYDTPDHVLVDDSKEKFKSKSEPQNQNLTINSEDSNLNCEFQEKYQIFPGKDYSNPRKKDFFELASPHKDMYDRQNIPRMPWHDVHMVLSGEGARDLSRHFIQRWNYLLRQKRPSRPTPLLIPPRAFTEEEMKKLNLKGTCEIQILRSSSDWSLGLKEHEQSVQNAYVKCIEQSEHFIYIENQFFVTSCTIDNCVVKNQIGDAIVDRIITAHTKGETWKAIIVIPLMPGFEANVDSKEGGSVRLIMQCQYMSISMGETSIFARLRRVGIKPQDYITFYSLRKWGLIGDKKLLTTEQLYIHAKTMIVDDRIAIIGSANINERSMRGTRDSEVCSIVRDKDLIKSKMNGKPYYVGKFSHSLRVRLMREHLGIDVDLVDLIERRFNEIEQFCKSEIGLNASILSSPAPSSSSRSSTSATSYLSSMVEMGTRYLLGLTKGTPYFQSLQKFKNEINGDKLTSDMLLKFKNIKTENDESLSLDDIEFSYSFNHRAGVENVGIRSSKNLSSDTRVTTENHRNEVRGDVDGFNTNYYAQEKKKYNEFLMNKINYLNSLDNETTNTCKKLPDFEDIVELLSQENNKNFSGIEQDSINIDKWTMIKRLFYIRKLYSKMLNKEPATCTTGTSASSNDCNNLCINKNENINIKSSNSNDEHNVPNDGFLNGSSTTSPIPNIPLLKLTNDDINDIDKNFLPNIDVDFIDPYGFEDPLEIDFYEGTWMTQAIRNTLLFQMVFHSQPDDLVQTWKDYKEFKDMKNAFYTYQNIARGNQEGANGELANNNSNNIGGDATNNRTMNNEDYEPSLSDVEEHQRKLKRSAKLAELERYIRINGQASANITGANGYGRGVVYDYQSSIKLMKMVRGHVVLFPTKWLKKEVEGSNWFYKADKIPPIQIYN